MTGVQTCALPIYYAPIVSPDGRWVFYLQAGTEPRLMRISTDGGDAARIGGHNVPMDISADGRDLLVVTDRTGPNAYVIVDASTGAMKTQLTLPEDARSVKYGRRPDLVAFILDRSGIGNVYEQPIGGGAPRQLTKFTSGRLGTFAYSPDRTRLVLSRGTRTGDVVLIRDFR